MRHYITAFIGDQYECEYCQQNFRDRSECAEHEAMCPERKS